MKNFIQSLKIGVGAVAVAGVILVGGIVVTANVQKRQSLSQTQTIGELKVIQAIEKYTGQTGFTFESIVLKTDDNRVIYDVDALKDGVEYDFDIDAQTAQIIESEIKMIKNTQTPTTSLESKTVVTSTQTTEQKDTSKSVAPTTQTPAPKVETNQAPTTQAQAPTTQAQAPKVESNQTATTQAQAPKAESNPVAPAAQTPVQSTISQAEAKSIASSRAGRNDLQFTKVQLTKDDDYGYRSIYEIEARVGNEEFDFDIDAVNGQILDYSYDIDDDNDND